MCGIVRPWLQPEGLAWLDAACRSGGYIQHSVPYDQCVEMRFAAQVIRRRQRRATTPRALRLRNKEPRMSPATLHAFWRALRSNTPWGRPSSHPRGAPCGLVRLHRLRPLGERWGLFVMLAAR